MGQSQTAPTSTHTHRPIFNHPSYQLVKNVYVKHLARRIQLYQQGERKIGKVCMSIQARSVQTVVEINRYYQVRAKLPLDSNVISLLQVEMIDSRGYNISDHLNERGSVPAGSRTDGFDSVCSLNIFESNCRRIQIEKSAIKAQLIMHQQYYTHTLQHQSQTRRQSHHTWPERQLVTILQQATRAANLLAQHHLKSPLLSPIAIKITPNGIKVAEWQFTHYFTQNTSSQTHLNQQGQTMLYHTQDTDSAQNEQKQELEVLECYYWPPQGTNSMQKTMGVGKIPSSKQTKGQVFSLGMTILQLLLQRPLYQKQTYSQKQLNNFIQQAVSYRLRQGYPLSQFLTAILKKMLTWQSNERISFQELQLQLRSLEGTTTNQTSTDRLSVQAKSSSSNALCTITKRGLFSKQSEGSGLVDQGEGDQTHPTAQSVQKNYFTNRSKAETSLDYHKLDYTIHRQRKEWQKFENRFLQSSYKLLPNTSLQSIQLFKHSILQSFPAEIILQDKQDFPHEQPLAYITFQNQQVEVNDEEEERPVDYSNCVSDSIKILDLSNIKANQQDTLKQPWVPLQQLNQQTSSYQTKTVPQFRKNTPKQMLQQDSLLLKSSKSPQVAKFNYNHLHLTNSIGSANNQSIVHNHNQDLFTSPQLMALIRSSARRHQQKQNSYHNVKLQLSPSCAATRVPVQMSHSTFVKEEFAKGWYEGGKLDGLRNGYGTFYYNEGGKYCGDWKQNLMHGRGTLYYADGRIAYQGQWMCDKLHGNGILYNQNPVKLNNSFDYRNFDQAQQIWIYYEGRFMNDDKSGKGVLQMSNGQRFQGSFRGDVIEGKGRFFCLDGGVVVGEWSNNRLLKIQEVLGK